MALLCGLLLHCIVIKTICGTNSLYIVVGWENRGSIYGKTARADTDFKARRTAAYQHLTGQCFGWKDVDFVDTVGAVGRRASVEISVYDVRKVSPDSENKLSVSLAGAYR